MINQSHVFSSFSVDSIDAAKEFYSEVLGLSVKEVNDPGCGRMLFIQINGGNEILIYPKSDHKAATFTVLNFGVKKILPEVLNLKKRGVRFENFDGNDENGINHNEGPLIAWFKDPAGNFLSVIEEIPHQNLKENKMNVEDNLERKLEKTIFIPEDRHELFKWWTNPELIEQWSAPEGMTLKVPEMEAREGGRYRYEHMNEEGRWVCSGQFTEFVPDEHLATLETVVGPKGDIMFKDLRSTIDFKDVGNGCEVHLVQVGFDSEEAVNECETGWDQCIDKLKSLIAKGISSRPRGNDFPDSDKLTDFY